jgi:isochorismate synthase EntC
MVPVLTETGTLVSGDPRRLLQAVMKAPANMWGYAHVTENGGFLGATPELLFKTHDQSLETMALAGTAKPGHQDAFLTDVKEIEEHEIVVRYLTEQLQALGAVTRQPRAHVVVAIRGICWQGDTISLPSGCGIVGGSAFDHEWRELRLKREAVLRLLALHS